MTRPDQLARIKKVQMKTEKVCGNCRYNGVSDCNRPEGLCEMFDAVWDALDYIKELEKRVADLEAKVPKWVSVKDRLPDKESMLCLVVSNGDLYVSHWHWSGGGAWFFTDGEYDCNVTHWAKAPELPKEEEAMLTEQFIANK